MKFNNTETKNKKHGNIITMINTWRQMMSTMIPMAINNKAYSILP